MQKKIKVRVYHSSYGCESGCCGHIVEIDGDENKSQFDFSHPYSDDKKAFAISLAKEIIADRWPGCLKSIDWDSIEFDNVRED